MVYQTESDGTSGASISLSVPAQDPRVFKSEATSDILLFLTKHRFESFSLREIAEQIGSSHQTVGRVTDTLGENDLVVEHHEGNQRLVRINRDRLSVPDDPLFRIPQVEFHEPVKAAVDELVSRLDDIVGIVLYGSVARGEADRLSDIDLWALTRGDRAANQREANAVARELEAETFNEDRYAYDIDVESVRSVPTYTEDIREVVVSGIPLHRSDQFHIIENLLLEEGGNDE